MRREMLVRGLILLIVGGIFIGLAAFTGKKETVATTEDTFDSSYLFGFLDNHEYEATAYLLSGTYEMHCNFSSTETVREFYVSVLDSDGYEIKSVYGPPAVYQDQSISLTFETQKTGQHTFILGGRWISVQLNLYKVTQSSRITYPYEFALYVGLPVLTSGVAVSIIGVLMKQKPTHWLDRL